MKVLYGILLFCGLTATTLAGFPRPGFCGPDEFFNGCASACIPEPSCKDPLPDYVGPCTKECVLRCECDSSRGYLRDHSTGLCVLNKFCPKYPEICDGPHEVLNECASSCKAEPSCLDPYPQQTGNCNLMCLKRCECDIDHGYVRDLDTGRCVRIDKCPPPVVINEWCNYGEVLNTCALSCLPEPTCQDPNPQQEGLCTYQCVQRCECDALKGFIRDSITGKCVLKSDWPNCAAECPDNEHMGCEPCCPESVKTCQNRNPKSCKKPCLKICKSTCECDEGYIRDEISNRCVRSHQCPNRYLYPVHK